MVEEQNPPESNEDKTLSGKLEKREPPLSYQRLSIAVGLLLAFSTLFTLLSSWEERININDMNYAIITTEFNRTQATILSQAQARQNYTIYSYYLTNNDLYTGISDALDEAITTATPAAMTDLKDQAELLASNNRFFFPGRYLKPDGTYDFQRNADEAYADIGQRANLDSAPLREFADSQLQRKIHFMGVTFAFGIATVIFGFETLFYWERRSIRFLLIGVGIAMFVFGVVNYFNMNPNPFIHLNLG